MPSAQLRTDRLEQIPKSNIRLHVKKSDLARLQSESQSSLSPMANSNRIGGSRKSELSGKREGSNQGSKSKKWHLDLSKIINPNKIDSRQQVQTIVQVDSTETNPDEGKLIAKEDVDDEDEYDIEKKLIHGNTPPVATFALGDSSLKQDKNIDIGAHKRKFELYHQTKQEIQNLSSYGFNSHQHIG